MWARFWVSATDVAVLVSAGANGSVDYEDMERQKAIVRVLGVSNIFFDY